MKDVKNCSISGVAFSLEVDAYDTLYKYTESIRTRYKDDPDGEEILADIEARIAELILSVNAADRVVAKPLIDNIIDQMGSVDDICADAPTTEEESDKSDEEPKAKTRRHLYRNIDDAPIGGVCSGIAAFIGCSAAVVRVLAMLLVLFGGASIWIYIILWIVMPAAVTARQKLEMRGEPITVSSIKDFYNSVASTQESRSLFARVIAAIGRVLMILFKVFMVCVLITLILALITIAIGAFAVIVMGSSGALAAGMTVSLMALTSIAMLLGLGIYTALQIINARQIKVSAIFTTLIIWLILSLSTAAMVAFNGDEVKNSINNWSGDWDWSDLGDFSDRDRDKVEKSDSEKLETLHRLEIIYSESRE